VQIIFNIDVATLRLFCTLAKFTICPPFNYNVQPNNRDWKLYQLTYIIVQ